MPGKTALIAAVSGRALAQAAMRAGYRPLVADFFCDLDTLAVSIRTARLPGGLHTGVDAANVPAALRQLADGEEVDCLVLGSGFERLTSLVDELARGFPLTGNVGTTIARIKDPQALAADCATLGIPHPAMRQDAPTDPENWLAKRAGGAGGTHVRDAAGSDPHDSYYYQQRLSGTPVSALFVADGRRAHVVGYSRQWQSPAPGAPYRYGGAVRLARFPRRDAKMIGAWLDGLVERSGLLGLCSADFLRANGRYTLLEINPRPGATLDLFDSGEAPLFEAHVNASRGEPFSLPRAEGSVASMIAYAPRPLSSLPVFHWPAWTADWQHAGSRLEAGDPVCTVFGEGRTAADARRNLSRNARLLECNWADDRP
ncbi:MAG: ATP-grasp domain-containing protein [Rhizobiaceae bacterium]|nr:ATP-grasp domain-containing protein [Rhizobiaceae bacterium]